MNADEQTAVGSEDISRHSFPAAGRLPAETFKYVVIVQSVDHQNLLREFQKFHGDAQGEILLSNQFLAIFAEAKVRSGVSPSFSRMPGQGQATTQTADEADKLCESLINLTAEANSLIPNERIHKRIAIGIAASPMDSLKQDEVDLQVYGKALYEAVELAQQSVSGEIRISEDVYRGLSAERKKAYSPINPGEDFPGRMALQPWHRQLGDVTLAARTERSVMCVDMARSSLIRDRMAMAWGDENRSSVLQDQITTIISDGFKKSGVGSIDRFIYSFGGDGGVFLFPDPAQAHHVAVEILKRAEEHNRKPRDAKVEDAMRCFRIGIDFGPITRDNQGRYAGLPFIQSTRLEQGGPTGEIRLSRHAYTHLPAELRKLYGDEEPVRGKDHDEPILARRCTVTARSLWPEAGKDNVPFPAPKMPNREFLPVQGTRQMDTCFVICPINSGVDRVETVFQTLIAPACAQAAMTPLRANDLPGNRREVITDNLKSAPMAIAYLGSPSKGWNTNVILEVGYRLALGLPLVILSEAHEDGRIPEYQQLLPFQLAYHNVITVQPDPSQSLTPLHRELSESRTRKHPSEWESPWPMMEFRFSHVEDAILTDSNAATRALFGDEGTQPGSSVAQLRTAMTARIEPLQYEACRSESSELVAKLIQHSMGLRRDQPIHELPHARVPLVFKDAQRDPTTGNPFGYLPTVVRWMYDNGVMRIRYMYVPVCHTLRKDESGGHYVCDL